MELKDIKNLETVVERLKAQGPSGVSAPHCWFCGKITAWFLCDCPKALAAQKARDAGKREGYPHWNDKTKCIENLDEETITFNETLGFKRYARALVPPIQVRKPPPPDVPGVQKGAAGIKARRLEVDHVKASEWLAKAAVHEEPETVDGVDTVDTSVDTSALKEPQSVDTVDTVDTPNDDAAAKRRAYKAEHERKRRLAAKEDTP